MAKIRSLPLNTYPSGTRTLGPFNFPNGLAGFDLRLGRCTSADPTIWPDPNTRVKFRMLFSFDGGANYDHIEIWEPQGGGIVLVRGVELAEEVATWGFSPVEPDHAKVEITVENGPIKTYLDVTIL